jgi:hypothetical protein
MIRGEFCGAGNADKVMETETKALCSWCKAEDVLPDQLEPCVDEWAETAKTLFFGSQEVCAKPKKT